MVKSFDELRADLAAEIKQSRKRLGLSQEALALQAEVDRTYVSQLERGVANPSLLILHRISVVLGVDLSVSLSRTSDA
ncbi:MAG: helix-turn-helix transcriptional regulator [Proteobacteria bacterium]|uniref:helix-turn-helix domain-containing protein n=1 Tax=unclassified Zoogloea TaxID=2640915 RepID=UPI0009A50E83|nr:helix-turn-helix transcriptional regulator [Zoogloea sp. LCSB751]MBS0348175.1 helix-turn-helix transcriptional regulator [Pseudomonadota bacterium]MBS0352330.1 helix-turn-helix transcriptional regulator [Pseudomonadota bacterium]HMU32129.1 helix-turn-helix transcriptional regulator [Nitrospira sp.]HNA28183.1 helix-turn-helix transcriptional regulator [Nitrospira sp.]